MSINSELTKTASHLRNARNAIIGRGGEISLTAGLKDLSDAIYAIPSDAALVYQTDESVAYRKVVPSGVLNFAKVSKVGGMSYKTKQLIPYPYIESTNTENGVTWIDNGDGSITATGSATAYTDLRLATIKALPNTTYVFSGIANTVNIALEVSLRDESDKLIDFFELTSKTTSGKVVVNTADYPTAKTLRVILKRNAVGEISGTAYPMCNYGETPLPYEPYFAGLRHTKVTEIKSEGANLIPFPYLGTKGAGFTATTNGLAWSVNADGSIRVVGTSENAPTFRLWENCKVSANVPLAICGYIKYGGSSQKVDFVCRKTMSDGTTFTFLSDAGSLGTSNILTAQLNDGETFDYVGIYIAPGRTVDATIYPMLNYGEEASPYKPYVGTLDKLTIPASEQAIDGHDVGMNTDYYNHLEFVDGKVLYHKVCGERIFNGTEYFHLNVYLQSSRGRNAYQVATIGLKGDQAPLCNSFESLKWSQNAGSAVNSMWYLDNELIFITDGQQTVEEWKAHLAERYASGNPLVVVYALAEPIVTDVTEYFTAMPFIEVEGGGTLTAVNEYEQAAPSTINYITETAGI